MELMEELSRSNFNDAGVEEKTPDGAAPSHLQAAAAYSDSPFPRTSSSSRTHQGSLTILDKAIMNVPALQGQTDEE